MSLVYIVANTTEDGLVPHGVLGIANAVMYVGGGAVSGASNFTFDGTTLLAPTIAANFLVPLYSMYFNGTLSSNPGTAFTENLDQFGGVRFSVYNNIVVFQSYDGEWHQYTTINLNDNPPTIAKSTTPPW
jgi:hypothetical protein